MKGYCVNCDKNVEVVSKNKPMSFTVRGQKIQVMIQECFCEICHEPVSIEEVENQNMLLVYDTYRRQNGLLTSSEIKAIRLKRGLSQTAIAKLIGCGAKTVTRYETGYIQDQIFDRFLRLIDNDEPYQIILKQFGSSK